MKESKHDGKMKEETNAPLHLNSYLAYHALSVSWVHRLW